MKINRIYKDRLFCLLFGKEEYKEYILSLYNALCKTNHADVFVRLKLSDAFIHEDASGDFEWTADMININTGKNDELLDNCKPLREYMILVERIRQNSKEMDVEEAVDAAVTYCIDHDILRDFLIKHRAEVKDVCITEFNEQVFINGIKEEGREQGRKDGIREGRIDILMDFFKNAGSEADAKRLLNASDDEIKAAKEQLYRL